ncbi:MAG TPA: class 3 fructose-bisphosphatase [Acidaminococcaceae bacterium]|nr:class 3 fructose-bisphosphatase [Acidaminococcaceae bacterium]
MEMHNWSEEHKKCLELLARQFPTQEATVTEIINLQAIINLPKGTEHFMSDLHGEYEAFYHILNNSSGVIREKVDMLFTDSMNDRERKNLCTLIYYPKEKLDMLVEVGLISETWGKTTLRRLLRLAKLLSSKYTRSKVRKAMPEGFRYVLDELLHAQPDEDQNRYVYHAKILDTIWETGSFRPFVYALTSLIKRLAVDHLHIVGDIYDRGPYAHKIMDQLMKHHSVDIQWGNHDVLWMGAAAGSVPCIINVIRNNVRYNNWEILENGYGISMRDFVTFAAENYQKKESKNALVKAINVMLFKAEGQAMLRHPEFKMADRLLFDKIDPVKGIATLYDGKKYEMNTTDFPTYDPEHPYDYSPEEAKIIEDWQWDFLHSEALQRHMDFFFSHGSLYKVMNGNLMFHGGLPMHEDGSFREIRLRGKTLKGRAYMDWVDHLSRICYRRRKLEDQDFFWFLWIHPDSPVTGRTIKTFERSYIDDESTWPEPQDPYYKLHRKKEICEKVLHEFGLDSPQSHIINGHTPVKVAQGDTPVRAGGKEICIDGGFCKAYQKSTGIAGYTLIFNSHGIRIKAHYPFQDIEHVLTTNADIDSVTTQVEMEPKRVMIGDTDNGQNLKQQIADLTDLLKAYRDGKIMEKR